VPDHKLCTFVCNVFNLCDRIRCFHVSKKLNLIDFTSSCTHTHTHTTIWVILTHSNHCLWTYRLQQANSGTSCSSRHPSGLFQPLICIHLKTLMPAEISRKKSVCGAPTASHRKWRCTFIIVMKTAPFFFIVQKGGCGDWGSVHASKTEAAWSEINLTPVFNV